MLAFIRILLQMSRYLGLIWQLVLFVLLGLAPVLQRYMQQRRMAASTSKPPEARRPTVEGEYRVVDNDGPKTGTPQG